MGEDSRPKAGHDPTRCRVFYRHRETDYRSVLRRNAKNSINTPKTSWTSPHQRLMLMPRDLLGQGRAAEEADPHEDQAEDGEHQSNGNA